MPSAPPILKRWLVRPGDRVEVHQTVALIETRWALVELPAPTSGRVRLLLVKEGSPFPTAAFPLVIDPLQT